MGSGSRFANLGYNNEGYTLKEELTGTAMDRRRKDGTQLNPGRLGIFLAALILGACTYTGADNPAATKFSWFSFLNGDDLRATCGPGTPDRWRLVYNAIYTEQVRIYEVMGNRVSSRVIGQANMFDWTADDAFGPWRAQTSETELRPQDRQAFDAALKASGVLAPPPVGLELMSEDFYWLVTGCHDGRYLLTAFLWPDAAFESVTFDDSLFAWDFTEVPVNPPRETTMIELYGATQPGHHVNRFQVRIGESGLRGVAAPF